MRVFVSENRKSEAIRAGLKTGQIYFGDPKERCGCPIWNLNKGGALIEVASDGPIPQKLRLISAALEVDKLCHVVSHDGRKISLKFAP
jgi:hypothetical protein